MTFTHALATNNYGPAKFIVATSAANGTHTTLATAMAAASAGDTIFLRDSVTENVTITPGVNITAWAGASANTPSITGTLTMTAAGTSTISGLTLITNSAAIIAVTGSAASILNVNNCYLNCSNNTGITFSSSNAAATISIANCSGDLGTTGIGLYSSSSAGSLLIRYTKMTNTGASTTASSNSAGSVTIMNCIMTIAFSTSSTGIIVIDNSQIDTSAINTICLTTAGSGSANNSYSTYYASGSASAISIGVGTTLGVGQVNVVSTNTNAVTGAGTLVNGGISFTGSSSLINTSTQTAKNFDVGGISFDGGNNTLNVFTQGTFTPNMAGSSTAGAPTYSFQVGRYQKVGRIVSIYFTLAWTAAGGATGNITCSNLPFTVLNLTNYQIFIPITLGTAVSTLAIGAGTIPGIAIATNTTVGTLNLFNNLSGSNSGLAVTTIGSYVVNTQFEV